MEQLDLLTYATDKIKALTGVIEGLLQLEVKLTNPNQLQTISVTSLTKLFNEMGYERVSEYTTGLLDVWERKKDLHTVVIPVTNDLPNYTDIVYELIEIAAKKENVSPLAVIIRLLSY